MIFKVGLLCKRALKIFKLVCLWKQNLVIGEGAGGEEEVHPLFCHPIVSFIQKGEPLLAMFLNSNNVNFISHLSLHGPKGIGLPFLHFPFLFLYLSSLFSWPLEFFHPLLFFLCPRWQGFMGNETRISLKKVIKKTHFKKVF